MGEVLRGSQGVAGFGGRCRSRTLIGAAVAPCCWDAPFRPKAINNRGYILKKYSETYTPLGGWEKATHFEKAWETEKAEGHAAGQSLRVEALLAVCPAASQDKAWPLPR